MHVRTFMANDGCNLALATARELLACFDCNFLEANQFTINFVRLITLFHYSDERNILFDCIISITGKTTQTFFIV